MCPIPGTRRGGGETPIFTADELKFLSTVGKDTRFQQEDIDRIIGDVVDFMDVETSTRSTDSRSVAEIRPLSVDLPASVTTRSGDESNEESAEELFYIVNFADDEGYSVIAADRRIKDEIALFVGQGSLNEEEVENPGLALMLSRLDDYAARSISEYERWQDSVETAMIERLTVLYPELAGQIEEWLVSMRNSISQTRVLPPPYDPNTEGDPILIDMYTIYGPWTNTSVIGPLIPVVWGQTAPFNAKANLELGKAVYTGCISTVAIQLMAYWQKPATLLGQSINWTTTRTYRTAANLLASDIQTTAIRNALANLFWVFGEAINMDWGEIDIEGSTAKSQDAINILGANGFTVTSKQNYSYNPVLNSLNNNRPVWVRGDSHKIENRFMGINWWSSYKGGHSWLVDGRLTQSRTRTYEYVYAIPKLNSPTPVPLTRIVSVFETGDPDNRSFLHNNFGWDGSSNGYYSPGLFDSNNGPDLPSNTRADVVGNFIYNLEMWTDIR